MGYCISLRDSNFKIKQENLRKALMALKADKSIQTAYYKDLRDVCQSKTLERAFKCMCYSVDYNDDGDICDISFGGDKYADDIIFFTALAPYVESGSYLLYMGDDGPWKWEFVDGELFEK